MGIMKVGAASCAAKTNFEGQHPIWQGPNTQVRGLGYEGGSEGMAAYMHQKYVHHCT